VTNRKHLKRRARRETGSCVGITRDSLRALRPIERGPARITAMASHDEINSGATYGFVPMRKVLTEWRHLIRFLRMTLTICKRLVARLTTTRYGFVTFERVSMQSFVVEVIGVEGVASVLVSVMVLSKKRSGGVGLVRPARPAVAYSLGL